MKIVAPINSVQDCSYLVKSPAQEFYCGIVPEEWSNIFGYAVSPNRREWKVCNLLDYDELKQVCQQVHKHGKEIYVTFNANQYNSLLFPYLIRIIEETVKLGVDGIIIADLILLKKLENINLDVPIIISGDLGVYNTFTLSILKKYNIKRLIFPRYLTITEMSSFINMFPNIEYEAFLFNERCDFCGAYCFASHGFTNRTYCVDWELSKKNIVLMDETLDYTDYQQFLKKMFRVRLWKMVDQIDRTFEDSPHFGKKRSEWGNKTTFCGLCEIEKLKSIGVGFLKIVGRGMPIDEKVYMINLVNYVLENGLEKEAIKEIYHSSRSNHFKEFCESKFFCYYPEDIE